LNVNTAKDYPLFIPPGRLGEVTPSEWSRSEVSDYAVWLQSVMTARIRGLLGYFGAVEDSTPGSLLDALGASVAAALLREPFSEDRRLTNRGYALAADMGLLLAAALLDLHPTLRWDVVRKPKSDVSYNLPVLVGFGAAQFDPIQISTTQAFGILRGSKDGTTWKVLHERWSDLARKQKA
jgi:hypothetical protein